MCHPEPALTALPDVPNVMVYGLRHCLLHVPSGWTFQSSSNYARVKAHVAGEAGLVLPIGSRARNSVVLMMLGAMPKEIVPMETTQPVTMTLWIPRVEFCHSSNGCLFMRTFCFSRK